MTDARGDRESHRYAVVVAGGAGTRLWPLSRERLPKQIQSLTGAQSLIAETVERLRGVVPTERIFVSTTRNYADLIKAQLPAIPEANFIVEPVARGTAAAFALLAHELGERDDDAIVFSLASDHKVTDVERFQQTLRTCFEFVESHPGQIALVGIKPTRPDTSLGYIKVRRGSVAGHPIARSVEKFVEKPGARAAAGYFKSGDYYWNAAYYCFSARTLLAAYDDADPRLHEAAAKYAKSQEPADYVEAPRKVHEIELIDSGKYPLALIPADFEWSDIGNWQALNLWLNDLEAISDGDQASPHVEIDSPNCRIRGKGHRIVVTVGVEGAQVTSTDDGVLVRLGKTSVVFTPDAVLVLDEDQHEKLTQVPDRLRSERLSDYL
jgi:mannose-1-phosphate guanylyltransferase